MKLFKIITFLFLISIIACSAKPTNPEVDENLNYFTPLHNKRIAIYTTYNYLGVEKLVTENVYREYHIWKENTSNKYILITVLRPIGSMSFPENIRWLNYQDAIYFEGNVIAFSTLHSRPAGIIEDKFKEILPDCLIVAQEFYIDKDRMEAIFKSLIVPDSLCSEDAKPVIEELNRVANVQ